MQQAIRERCRHEARRQRVVPASSAPKSRQADGLRGLQGCLLRPAVDLEERYYEEQLIPQPEGPSNYAIQK